MLGETFPAGVYAKPKREELKVGHPEVVDAVHLGRSKAILGSTFKKLDPERIAFVGRSRFDPAPFLDDRGRDVFLHPLQASAAPEEYTGALPPVQVHVVDGKREQFLELPDASGRLALFRPPSKSAQNFRVSLCSVPYRFPWPSPT